jgi:hypothetical protein
MVMGDAEGEMEEEDDSLAGHGVFWTLQFAGDEEETP